MLATRRDPQLGLHRLRLAGQLTELREADLSFTTAAGWYAEHSHIVEAIRHAQAIRDWQ